MALLALVGAPLEADAEGAPAVPSGCAAAVAEGLFDALGAGAGGVAGAAELDVVRLTGELGIELSAKRPGAVPWTGAVLAGRGGGGAGAIRADGNATPEGRAPRPSSDRAAGAIAVLLEADGAGTRAALSACAGAAEDAAGVEELLATFGATGVIADRSDAPVGAIDCG